MTEAIDAGDLAGEILFHQGLTINQSFRDVNPYGNKYIKNDDNELVRADTLIALRDCHLVTLLLGAKLPVLLITPHLVNTKSLSASCIPELVDLTSNPTLIRLRPEHIDEPGRVQQHLDVVPELCQEVADDGVPEPGADDRGISTPKNAMVFEVGNAG